MKDNKLKSLDEWYIAIRDRQEEKAINLKEKIENMYSISTDISYKIRFQLIKARFYLMMQDYQRVQTCFNGLGSDVDIPEDSKYYYYLFFGIFMLDKGKYQNALSSLTRAKTYIKCSFDSLEIAECKYRLSRVYFRLSDNRNSIKEALDGLKLFQKAQNEFGTALCNNLLGLNSTVLGKFRNAERYYNYVKKFAEEHNHHKMKCLIYLNLGDLFADLNLPHSAITYLNKASHYTSERDYSHPIRIKYILANQYFIIDQVDLACQELEKGFQLALESQNREFQHFFKLLKARYMPESTDVEKVYQEGLDYFMKNQLWSRISEHSEDFAVFYQNQNRFTEAVKYYDLSVQARKTIEANSSPIPQKEVSYG